MIEQFKNYIKKENLFKIEDKILLAISGGMDSVVMLYLFHKAGFNFGIAHCNFTLRDKESDADEIFVKKLSEKYKIPFFLKKFNTKQYAEENGISIQMSARELRLKWFYSLMKSENYDYVATAHHLDDQIETLLINLSRGTGIAGLHGILPKQKHLIHPLLFTYRKNISDFIKENNLNYREDSSNKTTKYTRNKIRHQIIPVFTDINPSFKNIVNKNIDRIRESEKIYKTEIRRVKKKVIYTKQNKIFINIRILKSFDNISTYLFEFLSEYNFNFQVVEDIVKSLDEISGKQFYSSTHRLLKDREYLIVASKETENELSFGDDYFIEENLSEISKPVNLSIKIFDKNNDSIIPKDSNTASLNYSKLDFPLTLRKWKKGDYFYPFGMNKKKKLSDFFIDQKLSIIEKENVLLLCSRDKIAWIIGHRIDNRFRITDNTRKIYQLKLSKSNDTN